MSRKRSLKLTVEALGSRQDMFLVSQKQDQEINTNQFMSPGSWGWVGRSHKQDHDFWHRWRWKQVQCAIRMDIEKLALGLNRMKIGILKQDKLFSGVIVYCLSILSFPSHFISVSSSTNLSSTQSAMGRMVSEVFEGKHFLFLSSDSQQNMNLCCSRLQCRLLL